MKVKELASMEKQRRRLELLLHLEFLPLLRDMKYVGEIKSVVEESGWSEKEQRQVFLFVTLMFYAPSKLIISRSIGNALMREMKHVTGCSQSLLSHRSEGLLLRYQVYARFNEQVKMIAKMVGDNLVKDGMDASKVTEYIRKWENGYGEE